MKLIVGLGNPGAEYVHTRHNLGFEVVDQLVAGKAESSGVNKKLESIVYKMGETILIKPQTFMNLSGVAVVAAVNFYKIDLNNLLVIHDDVDFELGEVKHQFDRSSAGHKGVESIVNSLGSQEFHRLRLGIGRSELETPDHVLDKFSDSEKEEVDKMITRAAEVATNWITNN
ncbi:MAG TPA: aminoacyl-tRNA hydrolase [Candidatus Saccharimonadales bacterium]|nr:aminoacyl-tRNA hydrolase [Candidatus Saccharimonadales bacterium]